MEIDGCKRDVKWGPGYPESVEERDFLSTIVKFSKKREKKLALGRGCNFLKKNNNNKKKIK